jgi:hypothetical protein
MPVLDHEFTSAEIVQRPFAVELGYAEWGDKAGHLLSYIGHQEVPEDAVVRRPDFEKGLGAAYAMATLVCKDVSEIGFQSRDEPVVIMPSPAALALRALGDRFTKHQRYLSELHKVEQKFEGTTVPVLQTEAIVPRVAEASYIWGRHGSLLGIREELPTVVRESGLITIRPQGITKRTQDTVEGLKEEIGKFQLSKRELLTAKLLKRYRSRMQDKIADQATALEGSISQAIRTALLDLASETPEQY